MDFSIPDTYTTYRKEVIAFAQSKLQDDIIARDQAGEFPRALWQHCADFGIQGLAATTDYGGPADEIDLMRSVMAMEALGYGCPDNGLTLALNAQMWTVQAIISIFGTHEQKMQFLKPMATGEMLGAHALTEPASGSDTFSMAMTAEKTEGGYLLNGHKALITLAPIADMALVLAKTKPELKQWGVSAFLVDLHQAGVQRSAVQDKMGCRTVPIGELVFTDCFVPEANRLGKEGAGFSTVSYTHLTLPTIA